jgi:hypothetical protein
MSFDEDDFDPWDVVSLALRVLQESFVFVVCQLTSLHYFTTRPCDALALGRI